MKNINSICIIDDDPITVFGMRKMLDSAVTYNTLNVFENGKLAIDGLRDLIASGIEVPEIIFLDINMPIMDGWQFLEEFITIPIKEKVRINIITSSIDALDREKWIMFRDQTHHMITYNNKPFKRMHIVELTQVAKAS
jgi:CheY-like chemotaxis protein